MALFARVDPGRMMVTVGEAKTAAHGAAPQRAERPSAGRIVHFVDYHGKHLAAIVTEVLFGSERDVDLHIFPHRSVHGVWTAARNLHEVAFDYDGSRGRDTWHWQERE